MSGRCHIICSKLFSCIVITAFFQCAVLADDYRNPLYDKLLIQPFHKTADITGAFSGCDIKFRCTGQIQGESIWCIGMNRYDDTVFFRCFGILREHKIIDQCKLRICAVTRHHDVSRCVVAFTIRTDRINDRLVQLVHAVKAFFRRSRVFIIDPPFVIRPHLSWLIHRLIDQMLIVIRKSIRNLLPDLCHIFLGPVHLIVGRILKAILIIVMDIDDHIHTLPVGPVNHFLHAIHPLTVDVVIAVHMIVP